VYAECFSHIFPEMLGLTVNTCHDSCAVIWRVSVPTGHRRINQLQWSKE